MTISKLLLFVLTALVGVVAIYFWLIHLVAAAISFLLVLLLCLGGFLYLRSRGSS